MQSDSNENQKARPPNPWPRASICSYLTLHWVTHLVVKGYKRPLEQSDVWLLREQEKCTTSYEHLKKLWDDEQKCSKQRERSPLLRRAVFRMVAPALIKVFSLMMLWFGCSVLSGGFLLRWLVNYFESDDQKLYIGILIILGFLFAEFGRSLAVHHHWMFAVVQGVRARAAIRVMIYEKALRLRNSNINVGNVANLVANDSQRVLEGCNYAGFLLTAPVVTVGCLIVMWSILGPSVLAGFAVMALLMPVQSFMAKLIGRIRRKTIAITDERVKLMTEILSGIKLIKLYAWERPFAERIEAIRQREVFQLLKAGLAQATNMVISYTAPVFMILVTFTVHTLVMKEPLRSSEAFSILSLFNIARFPLSVLPLSIKNFTEALVALRRLQELLELPELRPTDQPECLKIDTSSQSHNNTVIKLQNASFDWDQQLDNASVSADTEVHTDEATKPKTTDAANSGSIVLSVQDVSSTTSQLIRDDSSCTIPVTTDILPQLTLNNMTFEVKQGELVGIVGTVGAGKSSLLEALLGSLIRYTGKSAMVRSIAFSSQEPWIFSATVRANILFGNNFDQQKYDKVIAACALRDDFLQLPAGDNTEIGEKGVNLSGGQKARIALARAIYAERLVYLLDDPLSAVDAHVSRHLWNHCISRNGILQDVTRIIVTHQRQYLPDCDRVIVIDEGRIAALGTFEEVSAQGINLTRFLEEEQCSEDTESIDSGGDTQVCQVSNVSAIVASHTKVEKSGKEKDTCDEPAIISKEIKQGSSENGEEKQTPKTGKLVTVEDRVRGSVSLHTITSYFRAAGSVLWLYVLSVTLLCAKSSRMIGDWYISYWVGEVDDMVQDGHSDKYVEDKQHNYVATFAGITAGVIVLNVCSGFLFAVLTLRASRSLHDNVFSTVLRGTMAFFHTTPLGRLINRFAGDMYQIDVLLPNILQTFADSYIQCLLAFILIAVVFHWFLIALVPILFTYAILTRYFRRSVRELKRLENISRSPLLSHIQASVEGLATIRAFGEQDRYRKINVANIDRNTANYFAFYVSNRWIGMRLDYLTITISVITATFCVFAGDLLSSGQAGLAMVYALQMGGLFQYATRLLSETEALFTSVERLDTYRKIIPLEAVKTSGAHAQESSQERLDNSKLPWMKSAWDNTLEKNSWPSRGEIVIDNVWARYRTDLDCAIRGVSFFAPAGSKIGIIGRTGSGKSTLTLLLFRLLELEKGSIRVDDVDISEVNLYQLRSKLAIIPQDPTLFGGTIRSNVDPFGIYSDEAIYDALDQAGLTECVSAQPEGLLAPVFEGGTNFSVGQRQLYCLARAILRQSKIVILDEATANVDIHTDRMIQETIRKHMHGSTLLVIAHRLDTIMDSDYVLGLDKGQVAEFGPPAQLLGHATVGSRTIVSGLLSSLVDETGEDTARQLHQMAVQNYSN